MRHVSHAMVILIVKTATFVISTRHQQQFSLNVKAGIVGHNLIVYLLPGRLKANILFEFSEKCTALLLEDGRLNLRNNKLC